MNIGTTVITPLYSKKNAPLPFPLLGSSLISPMHMALLYLTAVIICGGITAISMSKMPPETNRHVSFIDGAGGYHLVNPLRH